LTVIWNFFTYVAVIPAQNDADGSIKSAHNFETVVRYGTEDNIIVESPNVDTGRV
jgi:hypothetical protein